MQSVQQHNKDGRVCEHNWCHSVQHMPRGLVLSEYVPNSKALPNRLLLEPRPIRVHPLLFQVIHRNLHLDDWKFGVLDLPERLPL